MTGKNVKMVSKMVSVWDLTRIIRHPTGQPAPPGQPSLHPVPVWHPMASHRHIFVQITKPLSSRARRSMRSRLILLTSCWKKVQPGKEVPCVKLEMKLNDTAGDCPVWTAGHSDTSRGWT